MFVLWRVPQGVIINVEQVLSHSKCQRLTRDNPIEKLTVDVIICVHCVNYFLLPALVVDIKIKVSVSKNVSVIVRTNE